ncbi:DUF459 domain-containing protein [Devosia albogilva]|uniref:DUF459 domain-containing protein n=1 Tax=Devosia albogilva TaxID=429726 RepID=A0ABW5QIJ1_9HYPH
MLRFAIAIVIGLFVFVDVAPVFAQESGTMIVAQQQKRRTLFDLLFGEEPAPQPVEQAPQRQQQQQQQQQPRQQSAPAPTPSLPPPKPEVEKAENATRLAVFGDSLAIDLSRALERFYAEDPNLVVIDQGVSSSGFVRDDFFDWNAAIEEAIAEDSFDVAVVIIGINDRQEIRSNGRALEPLTTEWNAAYQARIASFLNKLRAARKPVIWVGLPPMSKSDYSAAISQIANLQKMASFAGGAEYVDIYERFVGEDGQYASHGPDVNGQNARMRKDDGIHFATAGADKLAFYISQSMRTFYRGGAVTIAVADPLAGTDAASMLRPPYQGLGQTRLLEVAGAVIPISRAPARAGDLVSAAALPQPETAPFSLEQLVTAPVGRADAFGVGIDPANDDARPSNAGAL